MRFVLRLFGFPVLSLDMLELVEVEEEKDSRIEAGSAHNFERDSFPLSPTSNHEWEWEDRKRGFGFR